ncbi:hypothetical protein [Chryseosolibacter histidini]|uniref:hypothetical protein n=1 Tax=Chryseosolibacter histidini TaxID=2782349 RepID=UPI0020B3C89E|nr:hypothetical protein [Chryseosolibacter histidini]
MRYSTIKTFFCLFLIATAFQECGKDSDAGACPDAKCANYSTQAAAQAAYNADPECMDALDNDNDKIACEELSAGGSGGTNCPTTSNCGCSGKNKDQCGGACCKWVVGTGCRCK